MTDVNSILKVISSATDGFNAQQPDGSKLGEAPDTILVGPGGVLDSLGLVLFMVSLEERLRAELGKSIALLDEAALADENGPFRTVGSLANHITEQLKTS